MAAPTLQQLLALDLETRLELVQELWNSIVNDAQAGADLPITTEQRAELDDRVREDDQDPAGAIPWAEARARLHHKR